MLELWEVKKKERRTKKTYQQKYQPAYQRDRYLKKKEEFISYLGGKCQECGSIEDLEFHHRDEADKCFSIMSKWKLSLEEIKLELDKCDLLCHECHYQRTRAQRGWFPYTGKSTKADRRKVYYSRHRDGILQKRRDRRKA